jgi:hypothetical protein
MEPDLPLAATKKPIRVFSLPKPRVLGLIITDIHRLDHLWDNLFYLLTVSVIFLPTRNSL